MTIADAKQTHAARFRRDLILSPQEQRGVPCFVVKDPRTHRFFRFGVTEEFILRHLDGTQTLEGIRAKATAQLGADLTAETVERFIGRLERLGLLEGAEERALPAVRQTALHLRLKVCNPDRFLAWLLPRTALLFTRGFLVGSATLVCAGVVLTWVHSAEIAHEMRQLLRASSLLLVWVTVLGGGVAHELAHGLTCKRYGGEVREMGFLLIFFLPALYCNVSDAWLFREKRQRLLVLFAGVHCQLVLWALAAIGWRITAIDTVPHHLTLIVLATSGIYTVFNLNPLIKLDGYYLLSDHLEIPNLRARAFRYLRDAAARWWRQGSLGDLPVAPRERRIYVTYGLLAGAYSAFLLGLVGFAVAGFLTNRYQGFGFALITVIVMAPFRNRLKMLFAAPWSRWRSRRRWLTRLGRRTTLAIGGSALVALSLVPMPLKVGGEFTILPAHNADVRAEVAGIIGDIVVMEGDAVEAGQLLARLTGRDYRSELRQLEAEISERRATLRMLRAGPRQEEVDLARQTVASAKSALRHAAERHQEAQRMRAERTTRARAAVEKAQEQLNYSGTYLEVQRHLSEAQLVARLDLQKATEQVKVRQTELQEARAALQEVGADDLAEVRALESAAREGVVQAERRLSLLLAGSRQEQIEATMADLARLEIRRDSAADHVRLTELRSPITGIVTTPKLEQRVGQHVTKGDLVAEVYDLTSVLAEIAVAEQDIADVQVGDRVVLKARAYFGRQFEGQVVAVAPVVSKGEGGGGIRVAKTVRVATAIENGALLLKPDMTGVAKIYCGSRKIAELLTRRLARYLRVEFWSYW